jgi:uncharacterized membrane protein YdjX (TVP38/TMEM64 family)
MRPALRSLAIITAALCIPLVPFFIIGELPGDRWLSARDDAAGVFAFAGAGLLALDVLLPIPSSIVGTMLGARLGFPAGFAAAFLGMMTGQVVAYAVSRYMMRHRPQALPTAPTLAVLFLSRPVPVLAEAVAIAAGAARVSWTQFLLACGAGNLVYAGALALNGAAMVPGAPMGAGLVLPMLLPAVAWLVWRVLHRRSAKGG